MKRVLIVGGGVVGATIAYELSQHSHLSLTLIDRAPPAQASTGAALGILMGIISHKTKGRAWRLRESSLRRYPHLLREIREKTGETIPQVQGLVNLCFSSEEMTQWEELVAVRHRQGWELELWNSAQLETLFPDLNLQGISGAVYSPHDFQVNPQALTQTLIKASQENGVSCYWGVEAKTVSIAEKDNLKHCHTVHSNQGDWETDYLIIAAGLGSFPLTEQLQTPLTLRPVLGQAMRVRLKDHSMTQEFQRVITGDDVHLIPLGDNEYWVGATVEFPDQPVSRTREEVWEQAIRFCPAFAQGEILETWSGERPRPEGQGAPVIEYLKGYSNVILATGHYRNGVLLAPATALIVKELITEQ